MTVTYHSGRRIQGTSTDFDGTPAVSGGWKELARTTLGSDGDTINVTGLADKRYLMILKSFSGSTSAHDRFNGDNGSNYAGRYHASGTDYPLTNRTAYPWHNAGYSTTPNLVIDYVSNLANKEKLIHRYWVYQYTAGAGNAPRRAETVAKWANTSDSINATSMYSSVGNWNSGSEIVVLGYDPDDTHTDNFWEELADVNAGGSSTSFDTGTFTAKKYLWVQAYVKISGSANISLRVGNSSLDTGSNYAMRYSENGATDTTYTSFVAMDQYQGNAPSGALCNWFIVNNASNEKLSIGHMVTTEGGSGAGNAPYRNESVGKWANTSNQINIIGIANTAGGGGNITVGNIKVWGSN
jgi:hypothetical protein